MARIAAAAVEVNMAGVALAGDALAGANVDGVYVANDGDRRTMLMCLNERVWPITLTIQTTATRDGLAVADRVITVDAGARVLVGPFNPDYYNRSDGRIWVDFDATDRRPH